MDMLTQQNVMYPHLYTFRHFMFIYDKNMNTRIKPQLIIALFLYIGDELEIVSTKI